MADEKNETAPSDGSPETSAPSGSSKSSEPTKAGSSTKAADATKAAGSTPAKPAVAKKKVVSKRVTPKGGAKPGSTSAHAHAPDGDDAEGSKRYTPPTAKYAQAPSPTWVPVLMFAFFIFGCLFIVLNYARAFGEPENWRLLVGLGSILGGIITATNYR